METEYKVEIIVAVIGSVTTLIPHIIELLKRKKAGNIEPPSSPFLIVNINTRVDGAEPQAILPPPPIAVEPTSAQEEEKKKKSFIRTPVGMSVANFVFWAVVFVATYWYFSRSPSPPAPTPTPLPLSMVSIPGGSFIMGCVDSDSQCSADEKPAHRVNLDSFFLDTHETTVSEYAQCVNAGVCKPPRQSADEWAAFYNLNNAFRENHPVNGVDWNDANTYCQWRKKRLPTEAEFEYALRGGSQGDFYPWGNGATPPARFGNYADESARRKLPLFSWTFQHYDDGYAGTSPVCSFTPNRYGLCDISGNVWEWTADWHDKSYYQSSPSNNPRGPSPSTTRSLRGGSWDDVPGHLRASDRYGAGPDFWYVDIGFRCSRD